MFLIASEYKIKYAWLGVYYFVVYIFFNVGYYYNTDGEDRLTYDVFDWDAHPGKGCLWVFLILAFFVPGFSSFHYFVYRWGHCTAVLLFAACWGIRLCRSGVGFVDDCCFVEGGEGKGGRGEGRGGEGRGGLWPGRGGLWPGWLYMLTL